MSADFRLDDLGAGLLSTALFTMYMAATLLTTGLADRIGPKRMVGAGLAVSAAGTLLFAAAPGYAVALVAKGVQGIGSALAFVAGARYLAGLYGGSARIISRSVSTAAGSRSAAPSRSLRCRRSPRLSADGAARSGPRRRSSPRS